MQIDLINGNSNIRAQEFKGRLHSEDAELKSFEAALQKASEQKDARALKKAAQDLEQVFLSMMLKTMRNSIPKAGLLEESNQRKIFEDMMYDEYAGQMARAGGIGLADMIVSEFEQRRANVVDFSKKDVNEDAEK